MLELDCGVPCHYKHQLNGTKQKKKTKKKRKKEKLMNLKLN